MVIYCAAGVLIAARLRLGIARTSLVAPAAMVAVGQKFGAQRIVQDILPASSSSLNASTVPGTSSASRCQPASPAIGTVEDVTLRVTTVRTANGEVVITPTARSPR